MCNPHPAATIQMNADSEFSTLVRRSRTWKENSVIKPCNSSPNSTPKKPSQNRRRRRPTSKKTITMMMKHDDNASTDTSSTASCDDSLSGTSCHTPQPKRIQSERSEGRAAPSNKNKKGKKQASRQKKAKKTKPNTIQIAEISEDEKAQYIALDAEMVGVGPFGQRSALARVSLTNWEGETIYDTHVKVMEPVTDYRTFVSGITADDLASPDAISFIDCQIKVEEMIQDKIVVGHGLVNDFRVLFMDHPWYATRDTAKYEPFMKPAPADSEYANMMLPKKLKVLAKDKLGMVIQEEGQCHSPVEDAVAAMELYKKHRVKWEKAMEWKIKRTNMITGQ